MKENKAKELLFKFGRLFGARKRQPSKNLQSLLELAGREPTNGHPHLKIAEIYQELGETQKAFQEHCRAAEIFCGLEQYHKGAAIYTKILKQNPDLDFVKIKLAETYSRMGLLEQAFSQYYKLFCSYRKGGLEDKALIILGVMAELDPERFTLDSPNNLDLEGPEKTLKTRGAYDENARSNLGRPGEKETSSFFDLAEILEENGPVGLEKFKSVTLEEGYKSGGVVEELEKATNTERLYPNYHYQMGLVCREMGMIDEAIKQFRRALEMGQKPIEADKLLEQCFKDKQRLEDRKSLERTPQGESAMA
jgi:tetratricopeptide (TPR) repeat protein